MISEEQLKNALKNATPSRAEGLQRLKLNILDSWGNIAKSVLKDGRNKLFEAVHGLAPKNESTILPEGFRYFSVSKDKAIVVIEETPQVRTIRTRKGRGEERAYRLSIPYVVHLCVVNRNVGARYKDLKRYDQACIQKGRYYIGFRNSPLESFDDIINIIPLPNGYTDGTICTGDYHYTKDLPNTEDGLDKFKGEVVIAAKDMVSTGYWMTVFNEWTYPAIKAYSELWRRDRPKPRARNPYTASNWQRETRKNPLCSLGYKWKPLSTVGDLLRNIIPNNTRESQTALNKMVTDFNNQIFNSSKVESPRQEQRNDQNFENAMTILENHNNAFVTEFSKAIVEKTNSLRELDPALAELFEEAVMDTIEKVDINI